jgi:LCP family protein required for cell wall assembly
VALILVAGLIALGGVLLVRGYNQLLGRDDLLAPGARAGEHGAVVGPLNFLLIGSDYRKWSPEAGQRSDTIIVAHIPKSLDHVFLISVPRDLLVNMPPVPSLNFPGATTKINAAFEFGHGGSGGTQVLSQTLTGLVGVRFGGAAVVNFTGLQKAVDVLGGVDLCVDVQTVSQHTGRVFEPGCRLMKSAEVLDYLRQRQFPDGDFTRQRHQQQFLKAFFDRMLSRGVLTNPVRVNALLRAVAGSVTVDTGSTSPADLLFALRGLRPDDVTGVRIPSYVTMIDNLSYVLPSDEAGALFEAIRLDTLDQWASANKRWVNKI